jgi:hypothetical protein
MTTYLDGDDFDSSYLWSLRESDEIRPWEWTIVGSDVYDSNVTDEEFRL